MSILELGSVQIVTIWRTGNGGTKIDFSDIKNWIKLCLVRYELAPAGANRDVALATVRVTQNGMRRIQLHSDFKVRSLGVYDLDAAAEWWELTSRYSALEQSDRTHGRSTQASPTLHPSQ